MGKSVIIGLLGLVALLSFGFTSNAYAEDSVYHYVKPNWWNEALWPNGLKYRYIDPPDSFQGFGFYTEEPDRFDYDSQIGQSNSKKTDRSPIVITFPESNFGQLGPLLFFGQLFLDSDPPVKALNVDLENPGNDPETKTHNIQIFTDEDLRICQQLPNYDGNCELAYDIEAGRSYYAGYSIGLSPFIFDSGNSRFLKFSLGVGIAFIDVAVDLNLCTELEIPESVHHQEDGTCSNKTEVDSTNLIGIFPMSVFSFTVYEYIGEDFGIELGAWEKGIVYTKTKFKNHDDLYLTIETQNLVVSISIFF